MLKEIPVVRKYHCYSRPDAIPDRECRVTDADAGDVGNCIERSGLEHTDTNAEIPEARTRRGLDGKGGSE